MKTPLQVIADFGCPTNSMIDAIQYLSDREDLTFEQYQKGIHDIIGTDEWHVPHDHYQAKILFKYVIQETLRVYNAGIIPDMDTVFLVASEKTKKFIENNPWSEMMFNITHGLVDHEEVDSETGEITPVKSKGQKKEITERLFNELKSKGASRQEIIDAFVQETGMSKAGATTYFHTLKKEFGFKETTETKSSKAESKQELAERLYQEATDKSKPTLIALFAEKLQTSKLGAQTYYYACKKKFNVQTN